MGGMIVNGINKGGQGSISLDLINRRKEISIPEPPEHCKLPKPPEFEEGDGLTGTMGKVTDFMSKLFLTDACLQSEISNAFMGNGGDIHGAILKKTKIRAALGLMYDYIQYLYQSIQEFLKSLRGTKDLATT